MAGSGREDLNTISRTIATLETYTVPNLLSARAQPAVSGSANVQVIGVKLSSTYTITIKATDRYGSCNSYVIEGDRVLAAGDQGGVYKVGIAPSNKCGSGAQVPVTMTVNLEATKRGAAYYSGIDNGSVLFREVKSKR